MRTMSKPKRTVPVKKPDALFDRIVSILEQARGNVVRAVNTNMVLAYWLIGREIVEEIQRGRGRAKYGEKVIEDLSVRLTERYGQGFSATNLKYFRLFYQSYPDRIRSIRHPAGDESPGAAILRPLGAEYSPEEVPPSGKRIGTDPNTVPDGYCIGTNIKRTPGG